MEWSDGCYKCFGMFIYVVTEYSSNVWLTRPKCFKEMDRSKGCRWNFAWKLRVDWDIYVDRVLLYNSMKPQNIILKWVRS